MSATALIQARMGSSRLPGKVLMPLAGVPVLKHVVFRAQASPLVAKVVVLTSTEAADQQIVSFCKEDNIEVFTGSEEDVLDRYYQASVKYSAENIIRITADCPLLDASVLSKVVERFLENDCDYCANILKRSYPKGLDVEIMSFATLEKAWKNGKEADEREHVTPFIHKHPEMFKLANVEDVEDNSDKRWTLDYQEDYDFISQIFNRLYSRNPLFGKDEILSVLKAEPELESINKHLS